MSSISTEHHGHAPPLGQLDLRFGSNAVRLGLREWLAAGAVLAAIFIFTPMAWERIEPLPGPADAARLPYRLSSDYWQFSRYAAQAVDTGCTPVLGDSVVWGEYVPPDQTLTAYLNRLSLSLSPGGRGQGEGAVGLTANPSSDFAKAPPDRPGLRPPSPTRGEGTMKFANLGVDGTYPAALAGLVEYYGGAIRGRRVILHCNLLWMASPRHDLRDPKAAALNHPALLPQFGSEIKAYDETVSRRIGIAVGRHVPFMQWTEHLKLAYYGGQDLPAWTLEHPYDNPLATIRPSTVGLDDPPRHEAVPWTRRGSSNRRSRGWTWGSRSSGGSSGRRSRPCRPAATGCSSWSGRSTSTC